MVQNRFSSASLSLICLFALSCSSHLKNNSYQSQFKGGLRPYKKIEENLSRWTIKEKIGQLLIVGYRDLSQIEEFQPGGVALFSWSMKDVDQTRLLTQQIRTEVATKLKAPVLIAMDHEGGRVIRLRNGMTLFPDASAVGSTHHSDLAERMGSAFARELAYLGVDANFAPVLDIAGSDSFLGNRVWGSDPKVVSSMTGAFIQGMHDRGVMSVAKHFPGHGSSSDDAHFSLPTNDKKLRVLWAEDFRPFKQAIIEKVPAMMTAHVRVPEVDRLPASMSSRFLSRILRDSFKFDGVIITDDLEMKGAQNSLLSSGDLALQALKAGSDMLLVVWSKKDQRKIIKRLEDAVTSGEWPEQELDQKVKRVLNLKKNWLQNDRWLETYNSKQSPLRSKEHLNLANEISKWPIAWHSSDGPIKDFDLKYASAPKSESKSIRVALPRGSSASFWRQKRPGDEIFVYGKRDTPDHLHLIKSKFSLSACARVQCLIVTEPPAYGAQPFYEYVRAEFSDSSQALKSPRDMASAGSNLQAPSRTVVWAHMGLSPIETGNQEPGPRLKDGVVLAVLGSDDPGRLEQLFKSFSMIQKR